MSSAASPTVRDAFTPNDAAVLCLVCTGTATGSRLVATLTVRPEFTLAEVRVVLERLARTGNGGDLLVREAPTNVTEEQAAAILRAPLHPFDLTAPFTFVRSGGCRAISRTQEQTLTCSEAFPRFPRLGVPTGAAAQRWCMEPPAPLVVVPFAAPHARAEASASPNTNAPAASSHTTTTAHFTEAQLAHAQKRLAAAVLFVAQGESHHPEIERAMTERLLLSQQLGTALPTSSASTVAGSASTGPGGPIRRSSASPASFGQRFSFSAWSAAVTRWNANLRDYTGRTALQEAAAIGNDAAVKHLLSQSYVLVDAQTDAGHTALHIAIHANHTSTATLLIEEGGADVLVANNQGNTPLHVALLDRRASAIALICQGLRARGDVTLRDLARLKNRDGYSPVDLFELYSPSALELAQEGRLVPLKALLSHFLFVPAHLQAREALLHGTILHAAASSGHVEVVRYLCEDVTVFPDGCREAEPSPVNLAVMASSLSSATRATEQPQGAASCAVLRWMLDGRYQTPLHVATMRGHLDCASYLATRYPHWLAVPDLNGDTPLLLAIKYRQFHVAEFFLVHCAPGSVAANVCDHRGLTALHYVCGLGMAPAAEALLEQHGAKPAANSDRLALGSVCRPLNNNSRVWGPHQRNRLLVSSGATIELSSAKRAETLRAARRGTAAAGATTTAASTTSPGFMSPGIASGEGGASPCVSPSCRCGGGLRGSTPLLCALSAGLVLNIRDVVRVLSRHGGITTKEDACDLFFYLLSFGEERLASEIVKRSEDDGLVRAVGADNVLLLRFCEARVERGIRWCLENRCGAVNRPAVCGLSGGIVHPLIMSAAAGDVGAVTYLLANGADVNMAGSANAGSPSSSSPSTATKAGALQMARSHPLLAAIAYQQEAVAQVLVQAGARLSSGDGSWSALQVAALVGLEPVLRGLLGQTSLSRYDVAQALLSVLQQRWSTTTTTSFSSSASAATLARWQSRTTAAHDAKETRIALALAQHYDPTASEVHPTELLHLSAARGFFDVTRALLRRLAMLPTTLRIELIQSMPAAPARVWKLVEPTMASPAGKVSRLKRLLPNRASGKGGLYRLPKPFERLVLPNWRRAGGGGQSESKLLHRVHIRDVYSYAAAANDAALFQQLRDVLPWMQPWTGPDVRGWTAMDYALQLPRGGPETSLVCVLLLAGVSPRSRHGRRFAPTRASLLVRAVQSLVPCEHTNASSTMTTTSAAAGPTSTSRVSRRSGEVQLCNVLCALLCRGLCDAAPLDTVSVNRLPTDVGRGRGEAHLKGGFASQSELWTCELFRALLGYYRERQEEEAAAARSGLPVHHIDPTAAGEDEDDSRGTPRNDEGTDPAQHAALSQSSAWSSASSSLSWRWLRPVVHAAVRYKRLDALHVLQTVFACPFRDMAGLVHASAPSAATTTNTVAAAASSSVVPSPLLSAVFDGDEEIVAFLLRAGCSAYETSPVTVEMSRFIAVKNSEAYSVTPLCLAAWKGRVDLVLQLVGGSATAMASLPHGRPDEVVGVQRLKPEQCADDGMLLADALKTLFHPASLARCRQRKQTPHPIMDDLLARAVRALAAVGHPYLSPLVLRRALAERLPACAHALVACYGPDTVLVDLIPEEVNSLHYLAASPSLVPLLQSLLVVNARHETSRTASPAPAPAPTHSLGLEVTAWSPLALALQSFSSSRARFDPVDYALAHGCARGALVLLAAGWSGGSGRVARVYECSSSRGATRCHGEDNVASAALLVAHIAKTLQHFQHHRRFYTAAEDDDGSGYTVLHSAVTLGYDDVVKGLVTHMCQMPKHLYVQGQGQPQFVSAMARMAQHSQREHPRWRRRGHADESDFEDEESEESESVPAEQRVRAPSVYALTALHARGAHYLPLLEEVARRDQWLRPSDLACFFFNASFKVTRVVDALCRQSINAGIYGQVFSLLPESFRESSSALSTSLHASTPYAVFFANLWHERAESLLFHGSRCSSAGGDGAGVWVMSSCTALTAAIAAGRLEWVQYMAFCDPSMRQHRATLTRCDVASRRGCGNVAPRPSAPMRRSHVHAADKKTAKQGNATRGHSHVPRPHRCGCATHWSRTLKATDTTVGIDALVLCVLYMARAFQSRDEVGRQQFTDIFTFLLSLPGALTRTNVNLVALALAAMRAWPLLELLLTRADQFRRLITSRMPDRASPDADETKGEAANTTRYFTSLSEEAIPAVLCGLLGSARHLMHVAAHSAPKELLVEIARRSQREDVESCVDADGRTALYHALHDHNPDECGLACFIALRVPLQTVCCQRSGRTPLMVAASEGRLHVVTMLLEQSKKVRAQLDETDARGYTPLMLAAAHGHADVVELLLASEAKTSVQSIQGRTAVMLAAENGHDDVAVPLAQHFSQTRDLVTSHSTILHTAARGHACRTIDVVLKQLADPVAAVLQRDDDGHTALYVAHAFGCGAAVSAFLRVLFQPGADRQDKVRAWASQSLAVLHTNEDSRERERLQEMISSDPWFSHVLGLHVMDDDTEQEKHQPGPSWQRLGSGAVLSPEECDARLYLCDPRLTTYGWWRSMLGVNTMLALEAAAVAESWSSPAMQQRLRPGEKVIAPRTTSLRGHVRGPRGDSLTCLLWCAQTNNAIGVRVLAEYNVADVDGVALRWAAKYGFLDVVKLLVQLQMSNPSERSAVDGLFPFEVAARHNQTDCALYLLAQTSLPWLTQWMPALPPLGATHKPEEQESLLSASAKSDLSSSSASSSSLFVHTAFHRLAPVCEGEVLVAFVEQLILQTATADAAVAGRGGGGGGGASSSPSGPTALTCARLWAELQRPDEAGLTPFEYTIARGNAASVLRTAQLMQRLSDGAKGVPLRATTTTTTEKATSARTSADAVSISSALLHYLPTLSPSVRTLLFDFFALQDVCHTVGFHPPSDEQTTPNPSRPPTTQRLRFGDVRLIGIATLGQNELFRGILSSIYTVDHERQVLRGQLYDFPFRIRYEPESFRQCTLAEQILLLQWLSSSLVLGAYDGISSEEVETIELSVVKHRSHEFLSGVGTVNLSHSLYLSSGHYLSLPDVKDAVWSAIQRHRAKLCRRVRQATTRATKALRSLPHPSLRGGAVVVEWPLGAHEKDAMPWGASGRRWTALEDSRVWEPMVRRVCACVLDLEVYMRGEVSSLLSTVRQESDIAAVIGRRATKAEAGAAVEPEGLPPYNVVFRYVEGDVSTKAALKARQTDHPSSSGTCVVLFNETNMSSLPEALEVTLVRAVRSDVALVGIHYARSRFTKALKMVLGGAAEADAKEAARASTSGAAAANGVSDPAAATTALVARGSSPPVAPSPAVQFKLELESANLDTMPLHVLETMLSAAVEATTCLLVTEPGDGQHHLGGTGSPLLRYRSAQLVRDAVLRRLRHVLVLFTTRRDALVRFTGEKLMLCFTRTDAPSVADIIAVMKQAALEEEVAGCQRLLPDVLTAMQEKLHALLPSTALLFDEASLTRAVCTVEEDNPSEARVTNVELQASAYRLLVAHHSRHVLQPLVEGLTMGWNTPVGAVARQELREVIVRMETAESGSCYLSRDGARLVYYCPLHSVQYGAVLGPYGSWQILSASQVASLYVMQLLVRHRKLARTIEQDKAIACWTTVSPLCAVRVTAGQTSTLWLRGRNFLNQPVHRGGETFTFVGRGVSEATVRVFERKTSPTTALTTQKKSTRPAVAAAAAAGGSGRGDGRYLVRFTAPTRAGYERLHILLHGQPIAASPLHIRVAAGPIELANTHLTVPFNTVLVAKPFTVFLDLHDRLGNALTRTPSDLQVQLPALSADREVELLRWSFQGPSRVAAVLVVQGEKPAFTVALELICPEVVAPTEKGAEAVPYYSPTGAPPPPPVMLNYICTGGKNALSVVSRDRLDEIFALLSGQTIDSVPARQHRRRAQDKARRQRTGRRGRVARESGASYSPRTPSPRDTFGSPTGSRTMTMSDREKLFFRKTIRQSERRRLEREAATIEGGVLGRTFPPELLREKHQSV